MSGGRTAVIDCSHVTDGRRSLAKQNDATIQYSAPGSLAMSEHVLNSHALTAELRQFHDVHSPPLYRFLLRLTLGERHTAEDYLQETMLRAWRCWPDLPKDNEIQRRWLFTVARRVAIDAGRARQARPTEVGVTDIVSWLPAAGDAVDSVVSVQTVRAALTRL